MRCLSIKKLVGSGHKSFTITSAYRDLMSLQLKGNTRNRNIRLPATAGALIVGASYIIFKTFPHLKTTLYNTLTGGLVESELDVDDNEPIELNDSNSDSTHNDHIGDESLVNVEDWSDDNLKSWLSEVRTTNDNVVLPPNTNSHRKKLRLHPMLLIITLYPLLILLRKLLISYNLVTSINMTKPVVAVFLYVQRLINK